MPKKIAIICEYMLTPDRIGGMDYFFQLFDKKLKDEGCQVDWFFSSHEPFVFYEKLNIYSTKGISVEQCFLNISKNENKKYDVIFTHFTELCSKYYKEFKKSHINADTIVVDHNARPLKGYSFKKRCTKYLKSFVYSQYIDSFIAVSNYSKQHLLNDFGRRISHKIKVINNGIIDKNYIRKNEYVLNNNFIVACHLTKEKGIQNLINVLEKLKTVGYTEFKVDIFGQGIYEEELKKKVFDSGLEKEIIFKGSVDNLNEIYHYYDYLIHPSLGETFCYTVVESLLSGLPIITTKNAGNVLGLVQNNVNGYLFEEKNEAELESILINIFNESNSISKENYNSVVIPDLSLEKMANQYIKLVTCI